MASSMNGQYESNPALRLAIRAGKKYGLLSKCEVKLAIYWPSSLFACLWTETVSRSIKRQKRNETEPNKLGQ